MIVLNDCTCQHDEHEMFSHYRDGLKIKKLKAGDVVEFKENWTNFYGNFDRVEKDGETYDLISGNLKEY